MLDQPPENERDKNQPAYDVYFVKPPRQEGERETWLNLGAAWEHADGNGLNLVIDVLPVGGFNGRLVLRRRGAEKSRA